METLENFYRNPFRDFFKNFCTSRNWNSLKRISRDVGRIVGISAKDFFICPSMIFCRYFFWNSFRNPTKDLSEIQSSYYELCGDFMLMLMLTGVLSEILPNILLIIHWEIHSTISAEVPKRFIFRNGSCDSFRNIAWPICQFVT